MIAVRSAWKLVFRKYREDIGGEGGVEGGKETERNGTKVWGGMEDVVGRSEKRSTNRAKWSMKS